MEEQLSERMIAMQEYLEETVKGLLEKRLSDMGTDFLSNKSAIRDRFWECLLELSQGVHSHQEYEQITISFLRSSLLTKSHVFLVSCQGEILFLKENLIDREIDFSFLFTKVERDVEELETKLRQKFIRVSEGERETVRRWYHEMLYFHFGEVLETVMYQSGDEGNIPLLYGGYMEEQRQIGWI